jgi:signal transduction histidine kinase
MVDQDLQHISLEGMVRERRLLAALSHAAQAVLRARTTSQVYQTVGDEIARLGYGALIYTATDDSSHLLPSNWTLEPTQLGRAEEQFGFSLLNARFAITLGGLCDRVLSGEQLLFFENINDLLTESFPELPYPIAGQIANFVGQTQAICVPLITGSKLPGLLIVFGSNLREADMIAVTVFANQAAIALENARLLEEATTYKEDLRRLSNQLINAQEAERKRISLELHDELGQALTAIAINLEELEKELPQQMPSRVSEILAETTWLTDQTLEQVREMALGLRPSLLDDLGLVPALNWYVNRMTQRLRIRGSFEATNCEERLSSDVETVLYRVVQEALTNVAKHAQASRIHVHLECRKSSIIATIEDDGQGFDLEMVTSRGGVGLLGIRERVALLGGRLTIESNQGRGTRLTVEVPWRQGE